MTLPDILSSPQALHQAFIAGLERQLDEPGLGPYILVLANASFDPDIWPRLKPRLAERFQTLAGDLRSRLRDGRAPEAPEDDLMVFLKLMAMGFDAIETTRYRNTGPWELQFNPLRALRPARASGQGVAGGTPPAFNAQGFHFNKPFLAREVLWQGPLLGRPCRLLYNKFPFAPWHGLLVPEPDQALPQMLNQELHLFAWHLTQALGTSLPGFGLSYNSYGAYASVNHLHFQTFVRPRPLPVHSPQWRHNHGAQDYPAHCERFDDALDAWFFLEQQHRLGRPYNLLYGVGHLLCLPRRGQGSHARADWNPGFAWHEMAGGILAFNQDRFNDCTEAEITLELTRTRPDS